MFVMKEIMKRMYVEALFVAEDNQYYVLHEKSDCKYDLKRELNYLKELNYKLVRCVITNNKVVSLKARLEFNIMELKNLKDDVDYYGYDESLMRKVGLLTSRLLRRNIKVYDEIALQCYDIWQQKILERQVV